MRSFRYPGAEPSNKTAPGSIHAEVVIKAAGQLTEALRKNAA